MAKSSNMLPRTLLVLAALLLSLAARAEEIDPRREYATCMQEARTAPQKGFDHSVTWLNLGGGDAARHCQAIALIGLGSNSEAASKLEALAQDTKSEPRFRAELFAQAAQAWMLASNPQRAEAVLTAAIKLDPSDMELRIDRSQAYAQRGDFQNAINDLSTVLATDPGRPEALVFRASAFRQSGQTEAAAADLAKVLAQNPGHPEALLERGMLERMQGDKAAARRDWLMVIERAPKTPTADVAADNIQLMDGNPDGARKSQPKGK